MKEYLNYITDVTIWNIPYIEAVIGNRKTEMDLADVTVFDHKNRFRINGEKVHSCGLDFPEGAIVVKNGRMVASPELLFLKLASELSIHRLILLGLQLCSYPPGHPSKAITTKEKLDTFLSKAKGHRGQPKAIRAVKYVENGSASIMESLVYMILALPHTLGGYGLDGAVFNYEIGFRNKYRKRLGKNRCFADLYYKENKLAVEYDSFTYHNSPAEQGKDGVRSATMERQGIRVMHLNTIQIYDSDACSDFAFNLAARLEKRMQIRAKKFDEMHTLLRELLPGKC